MVHTCDSFKVLPGVFVGSFRDSKDEAQIKENRITHILTIEEGPRPGTLQVRWLVRKSLPFSSLSSLSQDVQYLCIHAEDAKEQNLSQYFSQSNDFIHAARMSGGNVLIHWYVCHLSVMCFV